MRGCRDCQGIRSTDKRLSTDWGSRPMPQGQRAPPKTEKQNSRCLKKWFPQGTFPNFSQTNGQHLRTPLAETTLCRHLLVCFLCFLGGHFVRGAWFRGGVQGFRISIIADVLCLAFLIGFYQKCLEAFLRDMYVSLSLVHLIENLRSFFYFVYHYCAAPSHVEFLAVFLFHIAQATVLFGDCSLP